MKVEGGRREELVEMREMTKPWMSWKHIITFAYPRGAPILCDHYPRVNKEKS